MAYPLTSTLIDNFNRANGGIGSAYSSLGGGFNISSNQIAGTGAQNVVYRNDMTPPADCEVVITVPTLPTGTNNAIRFYLRWNTSTNSGYGLVILYTGTNWSWMLYRVSGGVPTQIGSTVTGQTLSAGDQVAFQVVGNVLTGYRYTGGAWAQVITTTDSNITAAGRLAFGVDGTVARLDNLYGGAATIGGAQSSTLGLMTQTAAGTVASAAISGSQSITLGAFTQSAAGTVTGATGISGMQNATLGAFTQTAAGTAPPVTSVKLGIIGDSDLDEFRADDNRGGSYASVTFSPAEMLVRALSWNLGTWGTRSEPRRTGYAQNWARSTATLGTVYAGSGSHSVTGDGQHTGLAAQVTAGDVDAVAVIVGVNDFNLWNNTFQDVYNGTVAGANLTAKINSILANLETVLDALITAGAKRILVSNYLDPVPLAAGAGYTDPTSQARVSNAINTVNTGIDAIMAARSACRLFDRYNWEDLVFDGITRTPGTSFTVNSETITETTGDEPHNWVLASTHFGTVFNGLFANAVIRAFNAGFGFSLATMTEIQITAQAGMNLAEITGSQSITLGAFTQSSAGAVVVHGAQNASLNAFSQTAAGTVSVTGTQNLTLPGMTQMATGAAPVAGAQSANLGAINQSAAGTVGTHGAQNTGLGAFTQVSAGVVVVTGQQSANLGAFTQVSAGAVPVIGQQSANLGLLGQNAAGYVGNPPIIGQQDVTLPGLEQIAAGAVGTYGQQSTQLALIQQAAVGDARITAAQGLALPAITQTAAGVVGNAPVVGQQDIVLSALLQVSTAAAGVEGQQSLLVPIIIQLAAAGVAITGGQDMALAGLIQAAYGRIGTPFETPAERLSEIDSEMRYAVIDAETRVEQVRAEDRTERIAR